MDIKQDILWRVYLSFLGMVVLGVIILGKIFIIQHIQGNYWRSMADSLQERYVTMDAERGTIYSDDGEMLSTSVPFFDIHLDMMADGLRADQGKLFRENVDSLAIGLAELFRDHPASWYRSFLWKAYRSRERYLLFKKDVDLKTYQQLQQLPLFRLGRYRSGMIAEMHEKRINPYGLLANRTIGLWRPNAPNVGLEATYDSVLRGKDGRQLVRKVAAGTYAPVDGYTLEPENGKDIVTTIDVYIQDIAEQALYQMLDSVQAQYGTCVVMEVKTGQIKAIANLGRQPDGSYWEDYNYAMINTEPGSIFKLATLIAVLEDHLVTPQTRINLYRGELKFGNRTVYDAEKHNETWVTVTRALDLSSNVGFSQLAYLYKDHPMKFIQHLRALRLDRKTGIDLIGEQQPLIKTPQSRTWSATTLPWMGFGYEVLVSPLQMLSLYNAVANDGWMMKPYLVKSIEEYGTPVQTFSPEKIEKICSDTVLHQVQQMLRTVVTDGTARKPFQGAPYSVAGKTGTALVADGRAGYSNKVYQSSFVGYFPADDPQYSCIVVVRSQPHPRIYYGADVAAPVFRRIADQLYALHQGPNATPRMPEPRVDSIRWGVRTLSTRARLLAGNWPAVPVYALDKQSTTTSADRLADDRMPDLTGVGLRDAVRLLENKGLKVSFTGAGRVVKQSLPAGTPIRPGQQIQLILN
ncbi:cell division protein FtsI (penicillin-binding protein 3) [Thermoflavifilum aggregans]|uniref:Cell division protein FtsI (Penicillin-binding protein 3) n=1 Tax=Thermoflavifilum aggregans TaxID=454188 RepID=A0A2M9CTK9_9BACT|nr:penicillin-binding protein [Thermoflavifilum aggregans]PJJ75185.1 cell division protein FtsI (penicillin-binding protein 3) [Thermoflavifilum aggregans]